MNGSMTAVVSNETSINSSNGVLAGKKIHAHLGILFFFPDNKGPGISQKQGMSRAMTDER
jgi:hypothetical protein